MLKIKQTLYSILLVLSSITFSNLALAENAYTQSGKASWYGDQHHGKKTASGVIYNKHSDTVAHKTLPFGTKVQITNLDNGKVSTGVVRDRGPFVKGRVVDVSYKIAQDIGLVKSGICNVVIKKIH